MEWQRGALFGKPCQLLQLQVFQTFKGNFGLGHFVFHNGTVGRAFKLLPLTWTTSIAVGWKLYGCAVPGKLREAHQLNIKYEGISVLQ